MKTQSHELPSTIVYGGYVTEMGLDYGWANEFNSLPQYVREIQMIPVAAENMCLNGTEIWKAVEKNESLAALDATCKGFSAQSLTVLEQQLRIHCYSAFAMNDQAKTQGWSPDGLFGENVISARFGYGTFLSSSSTAWSKAFDRHELDFYGTPLMPVAAIGYWLFGDGITRNVRIGSLNLKMVATDFTPITNLLANPSTGPGTYRLNAESFSYNTFSKAPLDIPVAGMIGRVSGNLTGDLTVFADGNYNFSGSYTLNPDVYDADQSNRTWGQEALTTFLRALGDKFGHADYEIHFIGSQNVQFSGVR
ncbi:lipid II-degrading bacteriocin [Pseudomonas sp. NPDC089395]|uniref:lipid II-degrading bacteriocin n=1 Tax=Pseudomonas sp. NPDC089395 TaxID=3364460 RepID=UPI003826633E